MKEEGVIWYHNELRHNLLTHSPLLAKGRSRCACAKSELFFLQKKQKKENNKKAFCPLANKNELKFIPLALWLYPR
jgi:hypothetical protein